jgi:hypothetical protein
MKWFHSRADILFMFGYCTLFLMKIVALIILKREIRELLSAIYHERENPLQRRLSDFIGVSNVCEEEEEDDEINLRSVHLKGIIGKSFGTEM